MLIRKDKLKQEDIDWLYSQIKDLKSRINDVLVEVDCSNYHRNLLVSRFTLDRCFSLDETTQKAGKLGVIAALGRACADPDSYGVLPILDPAELKIGKIR
jgi:hypothetical protein